MVLRLLFILYMRIIFFFFFIPYRYNYAFIFIPVIILTSINVLGISDIYWKVIFLFFRILSNNSIILITTNSLKWMSNKLLQNYFDSYRYTHITGYIILYPRTRVYKECFSKSIILHCKIVFASYMNKMINNETMPKTKRTQYKTDIRMVFTRILKIINFCKTEI